MWRGSPARPGVTPPYRSAGGPASQRCGADAGQGTRSAFSGQGCAAGGHGRPCPYAGGMAWRQEAGRSGGGQAESLPDWQTALGGEPSLPYRGGQRSAGGPAAHRGGACGADAGQGTCATKTGRRLADPFGMLRAGLRYKDRTQVGGPIRHAQGRPALPEGTALDGEPGRAPTGSAEVGEGGPGRGIW